MLPQWLPEQYAFDKNKDEDSKVLDRIVGLIFCICHSPPVLSPVSAEKLTHSDSLLISRLVLGWIMPALLFVGMAATPRAQLLDFRYILATVIGIVGMFAMALGIGWLRLRDLKAATLKGLVNGFPDAAFMGVPILGAMYGPGIAPVAGVNTSLPP